METCTAGSTRHNGMTPTPVMPATWHERTVEETDAALGVTSGGLATAEAARRLAAHGRNELAEGKVISPWAIFFGQFKNLIVWILIIAGVVSGLLGEGVDAIAILAIVVLNAVIGFYQEYSTEKSIAALRKMTAPRAKVVCNRKVTTVPAAEVVPGNILELDAVKVFACDMAKGAVPSAPKERGHWIQFTTSLRNPWWGAEMLECGAEVRP